MFENWISSEEKQSKHAAPEIFINLLLTLSSTTYKPVNVFCDLIHSDISKKWIFGGCVLFETVDIWKYLTNFSVISSSPRVRSDIQEGANVRNVFLNSFLCQNGSVSWSLSINLFMPPIDRSVITVLAIITTSYRTGKYQESTRSTKTDTNGTFINSYSRGQDLNRLSGFFLIWPNNSSD